MNTRWSRAVPAGAGILLVLSGFNSDAATPEGTALRDALLREAAQTGKPTWEPMLRNLAELHGQSVHPPLAHFLHPFEDIGPGYQGGRSFGHIDLTHERLDTVRALPLHARHQIENELAGQQADGMIPGVVSFDKDDKASWKTEKGFPPIWVVSAEACFDALPDAKFMAQCLDALCKQIGWFESKRAVPGGGFYYLDVVQKTWESGMDEGIRYDQRPATAAAAVDATAHVYMLYDHARRWCKNLGQPSAAWDEKAEKLRRFIQENFWDEKTGFFYDSWFMRDGSERHLAFEGMWPVVTGAATPSQAARVIDEHLLNPKEFFAPHPIATVALNDSKFELRMWRGPAWNCMTYWAARGCLRYDRRDEARRLLEAALDATATEFARTGVLWEFYHPNLGDQNSLYRKAKGRHIPCENYIGHNPLFAMVDLWRQCGGAAVK